MPLHKGSFRDSLFLAFTEMSHSPFLLHGALCVYSGILIPLIVTSKKYLATSLTFFSIEHFPDSESFHFNVLLQTGQVETFLYL